MRQIGFRALRFDFVKGYAPRFQTVWDSTRRGVISFTSITSYEFILQIEKKKTPICLFNIYFSFLLK